MSHSVSAPRIGLLSRGDRSSGRQSACAEARLAPLVTAFAERDVTVEPVVYGDDQIDDVRRQMLGLDGVLVWVNPLQDGADRSHLDALLREVSACGVWISAHPDVIMRMGTKEVLYSTRDLGWGTDTALYRSPDEFALRNPRLAAHRVLVLKQGRGTGGTGVWKVELTDTSTPDAVVRVQHAETRDSTTEQMTLTAFLRHSRSYFTWSGFLVDQPFQQRLADGMIRAYFVHGQLVGFQHQWPTALLNAGQIVRPDPRGMEDPDTPTYQPLRESLETEWIPRLPSLLGLDTAALPVIWDADFLYGPKTDTGIDTYVLCEINVSCVWPYPEQAAATIAQAALDQVLRTITTRSRTTLTE
ncbi:Cj0069 family protein [Prauserella flavalba]|uniref:DUF6815 domain-containing protein n=1 Tax=Prauserella flavalba TaxID=1477506 RepID=A0A318LLE7_9PSEU|nr:Cj0069 family protein [Prauserella flavalba]PXY16696.1 hypothetical protein BA062_38515 [Prauserella flavalba]